MKDIKPIKEIIDGLADLFTKERKESEPYKDMFSAVTGENYEGLLRKVESRIMEAVLDACIVIESKTGKSAGNEVYEFLLALGYSARELENKIKQAEGTSCCVDKTYYILNKKLLELLNTKK